MRVDKRLKVGWIYRCAHRDQWNALFLFTTCKVHYIASKLPDKRTWEREREREKQR